MKNINIKHKEYSIFPIGVGTWGIGGFVEKDPENDDKKQLNALTYMLKSGMNLLDICYWNAEGKSAELLAEAVKVSGVKRTELVLINCLYHYRHDSPESMSKEFDKVLQLFEIDCIDSLQLLAGSVKKFGIEAIIKFFYKYLDSGQAKYISISNASISLLQILQEEFGGKLFSHEVNNNYEIRVNQEQGILQFAKENDVLNVIFQAIRRNRTALRNWPQLVAFSSKYNKTQNQIIFNWLNRAGYLPLLKSSSIEHINEALGSFDFELDQRDFDDLESFRPQGYITPEIDWENTEENGVFVHSLSNTFDDDYDRLLELYPSTRNP